jgi:hypothetical protein
MNNQQTQDIFRAIEFLGSLVSTPGVDEETKVEANSQIRELLALVKPEFVKLGAQSHGLVVN